MKYVIDEEELKELKMAVEYYGSDAYNTWLKGFLMQKPIEEITSGEVGKSTIETNIILEEIKPMLFTVNDNSNAAYQSFTRKLYKNLKGKYKLYIQEVK